MKIVKYIIIGLSLFIFSCSDDDQISTPQIQELKGEWNAYTIKGDDGNLYGLNQEVPRHTFWGECEIFNTKDEYQAYSFNFWSDSNLTYIVKRTHFFRGWSFHDYPNSCELTFNDWSTLLFDDTTQYIYSRVSDSKMLIKNFGHNDLDTIHFTIFDNKLHFFEPLLFHDVGFKREN